MLHHVTLEVAPAEVGAAARFWQLLGFVETEAPADLASTFTWLERGGTQIHLMRVDSPTVPRQGHVAIVVADFEPTIALLRERGFDVAPKRERWGSPRAEAISPGGHRVELMAAPPAPADPS